ncbi:DNA-binding response regulator [Boudabousia liubingyangii]|uniref:DNA-binding response regulator n=1 Tax=Boudabousia liubingyangii TaxID=1921764 RepID=A0A1Q5PKC9_9ACTO|nr:DNA-binding response regulator [Boudabousia liubingyangii]OKL46780.1 DNA-binding response regulator [Boudabousia liubingyangii]
MSIRVLLADDQAMVLDALAVLLGLEADIEVVAKVPRGDQVAQAVEESQPDVCLLDIEMPGKTGIEVVADLAASHPEIPCALVTTFGRPGYLQRALAAGAKGFLVKDTPAAELAAAVRKIHQGQKVIDPDLAVESMSTGPSPLTEREAEVLRAALSGASIEDLAGQLFLSPGTVRNHISSAIAKTHTNTRMEAALAAQQAGWL